MSSLLFYILSIKQIMEQLRAELKKINDAIKTYKKFKRLCSLSEEEIRCLPREYLLNHVNYFDRFQAWNKLPNYIREDEEFKKELPCFKHYNTGRTHIDGPPPRKSVCRKCQINE